MSDDERPTVALDPRTVTEPSWKITVAVLERMGSWTVLALRLGTLALLQECTRGAPASLVTEARNLVEALAHMPWDER